MKRLRRRLFNLAAAVCLAGCAASVIFWVRSYWRCDNLIVSQGDGQSLWLRAERGKLLVWKQRRIESGAPLPTTWLEHHSDRAQPNEPQPPLRVLHSTLLGFGAERASSRDLNTAAAMVRKLRQLLAILNSDANKESEMLSAVIGDRDLRAQRQHEIKFDQWLSAQNNVIEKWDRRQEIRESHIKDLHTEISALESARYTVWQAAAPIWAPLLCIIWIPALHVATQWRLHHRIRSGRCIFCGYDLRATPQRCPECGAVAKG